MKTISIANLKGGVHKTTTAVSMAELIADRYQKKVLLLDNDKQGMHHACFGYITRSHYGGRRI